MFMCDRRQWSAVMIAGSLLLPSSSALRAQAQTQAPAPATVQEKKPETAPAAKTAEIEWLTDAEGRQYRLEPIPKSQATKVSETKVRTIFGVPADLAREDEQFFYIKLYKTEPAPITKTPAAPPARGGKPSSPGTAPGRPGAAKPGASGKAEAAGAASRGGDRPAEPLPAASARLRWTAAGAGLPAAGQWREGLVLADLTGDGRLDIAASGARKTLRPPVVFTSDGKAWTLAKGITFAARQFDYGDIALGDFNGDGKLDAALGIHLRGLMAFRRDESGGFADASTGLPFAANSREQAFSSRAVALTDCNGDGRLDFVALGEGPRLPGPGVNPQIAMGLASYAQQADGAWQAVTVTPGEKAGEMASGETAAGEKAVGENAAGEKVAGQKAVGEKTVAEKAAGEYGGSFGSTLAIADVDGDKRPDAVVAPGTLGDTRIVHHGDGACGWRAEAVDAVRPRSYVTSVAAGDVTGDGVSEIAVGYVEFSSDDPSYGVDVLTRGADGQWTRRPLVRESGRARTEAIAIGDLDGDQRGDVVTVGAAGTTTIFLGDGRGGFTRERQTLPAPGGCAGATAVIGDLDADGLGDIVISYAQEASATMPDVCKNEGGITAWKTSKSGR